MSARLAVTHVTSITATPLEAVPEGAAERSFDGLATAGASRIYIPTPGPARNALSPAAEARSAGRWRAVSSSGREAAHDS